MRKVLIFLLLLAPTAVFAQTSVEITPTVGYRWGGSISASDTDLLDMDMDIQPSASLGLIVNIPFNRWLELELMIDHQSSELGERRLFEPGTSDFDIDVTYYHVGLGFQWHARQFRPFIVGSLGMASIDPDTPGFRSEDRFSASFGGGVKIDLNERVGFRLGLRGFWTDTASSRWWNDDWWDDNCHGGSCDCYHGECWGGFTDLVQGELTVGVIIKL